MLHAKYSMQEHRCTRHNLQDNTAVARANGCIILFNALPSLILHAAVFPAYSYKVSTCKAHQPLSLSYCKRQFPDYENFTYPCKEAGRYVKQITKKLSLTSVSTANILQHVYKLVTHICGSEYLTIVPLFSLRVLHLYFMLMLEKLVLNSRAKLQK